MKKIVIIIFLSTLLPSLTINSMADTALDEWRDFSQTAESKQLIEWLRCHARSILTGSGYCIKPEIKTPQFFGKFGIFITLKNGKSVRGCYGAFFHTNTGIEAVLTDYLAGALTRDPRYKPLRIQELDQTEIIITIAAQPHSVDPDSVDVLRHGIALTCIDGSTTVYVPYELRGVQDLRKYFSEKECQVSAFDAVTLK
jgi:AMMECR1 domain-containing protein